MRYLRLFSLANGQPRVQLRLARRMWQIFMSAALLCLLIACGNDGPTTVCKPGSECEKRTLHQCECCSADRVASCKSDRKEACGTGNLNVEGTPDDCTTFNKQWDQVVERGDDPCTNFEPEQIQEHCETQMMDSYPGSE